MPELARTFPPGGAWAYFKFYCGEITAERLLRGLHDLTGPIEQDGVVSRWFFIRYADPLPHLRIRFCVNGDGRWQPLLDRVHAHFDDAVRHEFVSRVQIDTYNREIERYGAGTMELSERLFHHDSRMVLGALRAIHDADDEHLRWQFGLMAIERFLADLRFDRPRRFSLIDRLGKGFLAEKADAKEARAGIERRFREHKAAIERALSASAGEDPRLAPLLALIDARSAATAADLEALLADPAPPESRDGLIASHLHMFCNRLFPTRQRDHELVLYWFLAKHLRGQIARQGA